MRKLAVVALALSSLALPSAQERAADPAANPFATPPEFKKPRSAVRDREMTGRLLALAVLAFVVLALVVAAAIGTQEPRAREPLEIARTLVERYPDTASMSYIPALAWSGALRLSALTGEERWKEKARQQMRPFISGDKPALAEPYLLTSIAGHFALSDAGENELAGKAADFILPAASGEVVRFARAWTDDMFMASALLSRAAARSNDGRYAQAVGRLLTSYADKLQRSDGLFIHAIEGPHAWGRGNGFAALGLVEGLTYLPASWPDRGRVLEIYRRHMRALAARQSDEGSWHQVVDEPASYRELTVTAMTVAAMARGVRLGWLDRAFVANIDRGWTAVAARVGDDGSVRDVCAGTGAGPTKDYYVNRPIVNGPDDRGGAMVLLAALEVEELRRAK
jgi:unsaturated rhamnogalacturonyl hydrolase